MSALLQRTWGLAWRHPAPAIRHKRAAAHAHALLEETRDAGKATVKGNPHAICSRTDSRFDSAEDTLLGCA